MQSNQSLDIEPAAPDYNPLQADSYAEHLAEVNKSKQVIASTNILNSQGMLLVKKGQPLSQETVQRIVQFKLARPLEACVDIADSLTEEKLLSLIDESLQSDNARALYRSGIHNEIAEFCRVFFQFPLLVQKLTVLWLQMPTEFNKSITVAWASLAAARRMRLGKDERLHLFIAALMHDIGMLHIPREITSQAGNLTQEQWRAIKSHPVIGQKILEQVQNLPAAVSRAVLEHHEMADGTGYPAGKFGAELGVHGQLINILDSAFAILFNKLAPQNLGSRFIAPILQINSSSYRMDVFNAVISGMHEFEYTVMPIVPRDQCKSFIEGLATDAELLNQYCASVFAIADAMVNTAANAKNRLLQAVQTLSQQLKTLLRTSGILDKNHFVELMKEVEGATAEGDTELEETYLMLQELRWQFSKLIRVCLSLAECENVLNAEQRQSFSRELGNLTPPPTR